MVDLGHDTKDSSGLGSSLEGSDPPAAVSAVTLPIAETNVSTVPSEEGTLSTSALSIVAGPPAQPVSISSSGKSFLGFSI